MKKNIFCFSLAFSIILTIPAFSEDNLPTVLDNFQKTPYYQEMQKRSIGEAKKYSIENKTEFLNKMHQSQNYTEDEYKNLYNNFEVNPPIIEKDGAVELNSDYLTKNQKYIEKDGIIIENPNYVPSTFQPTTLKSETEEDTEKRLGKKSFNINPDFFYE